MRRRLSSASSSILKEDSWSSSISFFGVRNFEASAVIVADFVVGVLHFFLSDFVIEPGVETCWAGLETCSWLDSENS